MYRGERLNTITHLVGAVLALAGLVILVVRASLQGDPWKIVSFSVYGAALAGLYCFSTVYHGVRGSAKSILRKIDHAAIYVLIAGTYTPFTLVTLRGALGWTVFGVIWGLAVAGIVQDTVLTVKRRFFSVMLYLAMGWLSLIAIRPLANALSGAGLAWLIAGGVFYTIGVLFYAFDKRIPHGHGIFHLFVLAGSMCHYLTIILYVR